MFVALLVLCSFVLSSCTLFPVSLQKIAFSDSEMELTINEAVTPKINFFPVATVQTEYTLESNNSEVLEILGKNVKAVGIGSAKLKVVSENAKITSEIDVNVSYADISQIDLVVNSTRLVRDTAIATASTDYIVSAMLNTNTDPQALITWLVNDVIQPEQTKVFSLTTLGVGSTKVTAKAGDSSRDIYFNVYDSALRFEPSVGNALVYMNEDKYHDEIFRIVPQDNLKENPPIVYEWYVNNVAQSETSSVFSYKPKTVGEYIIVGKANGATVSQSKIIAKGSIIPKNVNVDFDDTYPDIMITWDEIAGFTDFIVKINGTDYSSRELANKSKFTTSSFNANGLIDIAKTNMVSVKSLTSSENFEDSVFSEIAYSNPIPSNVESEFLTKFYYGGNRYIENQEEFNDIIAYIMLYRIPNLTVYMNYYVSGALKTELATAFENYSATGIYTFGAQATSRKNIYNVTFSYQTANYPTLDTSFTGDNAGISHLAGVQPHINTDVNKYRPSNYEFAIDKVARTASVTKSEELFYTVNLGYRPIVTKGSVAEKIYKEAREVVRTIVTDDMNDFQKVHAIYDWVMWVNTYNYEVLKYSAIEEAVKYKAFYLDGIFNRGSTKPLAVCDGISKAIVLLCRIEGIECIKIGGEVRKPGVAVGSGGGHAWNKVKVDGKWYIVDGTWGDGLYESISGKKFELASHQFLFLSDNSTLLNEHYQQTVNSYPKAVTQYDWFVEMYTFDGITYDHNITSLTELESFIKIMVEMRRQSGGKSITKEIKISSIGYSSVKSMLKRYLGTDTVIYLETTAGNICYIIME